MEDAHERDTGRVTHNVYFYHIAQSNAKIQDTRIGIVIQIN